MKTSQNQTGWNFAARWVAITTVTFIITTAIAFTSMWSIVWRLLEGLDQPAAALISSAWVGALMGLGLGIGQAIMLRDRGIKPMRWVVGSILGGAAGFALFSVLTSDGNSPTPRLQLVMMAGALAGLGIGLAQWTVLRRLPNAPAWIAVTVAAFVPVALLAYNGREGWEWLILLAMGVTVAGITGLGALWLLGGPRPAVVAQVGLMLTIGLLLVGCGGSSEPSVRFSEPREGASVSSPVRVVMAAENFTVEPAGDGAIHDGAGHLHIMVDTPCVEAGQTIPKDETHLHFGDGRTETELDLSSGMHTLCLQAADGAHTALPGEGMTHTISVTVP